MLGGYASVAVHRRRGLGGCRSSWPSRTPGRRGQPPGRPLRQGRGRAVRRNRPAPQGRGTGNPVRPEILAIDRRRDRDRGPRGAGPADRPHGRRGVQRLARFPDASTRRCGGCWPIVARPRATWPIRHVIGRRDWDEHRRRAARRCPPTGCIYQAVRYEDRHGRCCSRPPTWRVGRGRRHHRGRAGRGRPARPSSCRCRSPRGTTRPPTPRRWCGPGRPSWCPTPSSTRDRLAARADPLLAEPARLAAMAEAPGPWPTATPPTGWPTSSRSTPVPEPVDTVRRSAGTVDLPSPRSIHVVGRRRRRHERHRQRAGGHGPPGLGQRPQGVGRARAAARRRASTCTSGHDADNLRADARPRHDLDRDPRTQPRGRGRARAAASRCCAGPTCWRPSPPRAAPSRWPARTARPRRRRCSPWCSIEAGLRPVVHHRRRRQRDRHAARSGPTASWFVVEADESDGTFLELPRQAAVVTNVEPDHLEHYGAFEALQAAFDRFLGGDRRAAASCAPTTRGRGQLGAAHGARHLRHVRRRRLPHGRPRAGRGGALGFRLVHDGGTVGEVQLPVAGPAQRPQRGCAAVAMGLRARRALRGRARPRWPASAAWPAASSTGARSTASPSSTTTPTCPPRWPAALAAAGDGGWRRVVCVFQPHRYSRTGRAVAGLRRRLRRRRRAGRHRRLRRRRDAPARASRASSSSDAVLDAHPWRRRGLPAAPRPTSWPSWSPSSAPATCASRSAPAT